MPSTLKVKKLIISASLIVKEAFNINSDAYWTTITEKERTLFPNEIITYDAPYFYSKNGKEVGFVPLLLR